MDGTVVIWGARAKGGDLATSSPEALVNVQTIYNTRTAFAALKKDGTVMTWPGTIDRDSASGVTYTNNGGNSSAV